MLHTTPDEQREDRRVMEGDVTARAAASDRPDLARRLARPARRGLPGAPRARRVDGDPLRRSAAATGRDPGDGPDGRRAPSPPIRRGGADPPGRGRRARPTTRAAARRGLLPTRRAHRRARRGLAVQIGELSRSIGFQPQTDRHERPGCAGPVDLGRQPVPLRRGSLRAQWDLAGIPFGTVGQGGIVVLSFPLAGRAYSMGKVTASLLLTDAVIAPARQPDLSNATLTRSNCAGQRPEQDGRVAVEPRRHHHHHGRVGRVYLGLRLGDGDHHV